MEESVIERFGPRSWVIKCGTGTFRRRLDHIKTAVDQSQAEDHMPSGHGEQGATTRQVTVPVPYMLEPPADSPLDLTADSHVSSSFSLTEQPGPPEPVTQMDTTASHPQRHRQLSDRFGDFI
ncbi:hypothetical protein MRX96_014872 [Rhipicephalus microplus]